MALFRSSSALSLLCLALVCACGGSSELCLNVICGQGRVCDKASGVCVVDLTPKDAGPVVDAGAVDAGVPDAGMADAGPGCLPACAATEVCDPVSLNCVQCVDNGQCSCPAEQCDLVSHSCVPFVQPRGESCADAPVIVFQSCSPTRTTFEVDLALQSDDLTGTCSQPSGLGRDAVFLLNVPTTRDVKVSTAQAPGSNAEAVSYLRSSPCASGPELACRDTLGAPSSFRARSVAPGVYALVIDAYDQATSGRVEVTVELLPPVTNDSCAAPLEASTDGGSAQVDLSGASDDLAAGCNLVPDSRDAVWQVTLPQRSDFHAVVRAQFSDAGINPVAYLSSSPCASGGTLSCVDEQTDQPEHLRARGLDAGTYFLIVEGRGGAGSGPVELTSWATAPVPLPPNDTCAAPRLIDFQATNSVRFTVDTSAAEDDAQGSCGVGGAGREAVYFFSLASTRTVTVTSEAADGSEAIDPVIYLRAGSCAADAGTEIDCADDLPLTPELLVATLSAGQYFLFVDSYTSSTAGPTTVTVTLSP